MVEALPDPFALRDYAATGAGYLNGGLQRENWEHSMRQITGACMKDITYPGINYLVKHAGCILRRLFSVAMYDIKEGEQFSATFKLMPSQVEIYLKEKYDSMLWDLMENAANLTHSVTKAMYSTINPNLPTFHPTKVRRFPEHGGDGEHGDEVDQGYVDWVMKRIRGVKGTSEAKHILPEDSRDRATKKNHSFRMNARQW